MVFIFFAGLYLFISFLVCLKSSRYSVTSIAVIAALSRFLLCAAGVVVELPFGGVDGANFERIAWIWSQGSLWDAIATIDVSRSYVISSITAILYNLFERNMAIPIFINGILGVLIFYNSIVLASLVWGNKQVTKTIGLVVALHPMLNVNSAIMLRENYIALFVILASISLVKYVKYGSFVSILYFMGFVLIASFFHGSMLLYAMGLPIVLVFGSDRVSAVNKLISAALITFGFVGAITQLDPQKLSVEGGIDIEYLSQLEEKRQESNTSYLVGMSPSSFVDVLWQAPIRAFYLFTKPFPWDVRTGGQAVVMLDAILWSLIIYLIFRNWQSIRANPSAMALFLCSLVVIVAFAYGTSNYGTGVRHRTKFLVMALVVIGPFISKKLLGFKPSLS